jgi:YggT family protein
MGAAAFPCQGLAAGLSPPGRRACRPAAPRLPYRRFARGLGGFMGGFLIPVIDVIIALIHIYWWIVIISAVMSWLIAFNVINTYSRPVAMIGDFLYRATEPALRPIRQFLPNLGGLDISPIILLLILWFIERELIQLEFYVARL